jgi:hypothetical protein
MATTREHDDVLRGLREAFEPWLGDAARVAIPFFGMATGYVPPFEAGVEGYVLPADTGIEDADGMRLHLLGRAHELIAALASAGWVLKDAADMEFRGELKAAVVTVTGKLFEPPQEYGISLSVSLSLIRVTPEG